MLDRDALVAGLRELGGLLRDREVPATIRIVGGAALGLEYFDRGSTIDVDAAFRPSSEVERAASIIAERRSWPVDWLNARVVGFLPVARDEWRELHRDGDVLIEIAGPSMLLAMKLHAGRRGRDDQDIAVLMSIVGVSNLAEAEQLYESFYPGEALRDRSIRIVEAIDAAGLPEPPAPLPPIEW